MTIFGKNLRKDIMRLSTVLTIAVFILLLAGILMYSYFVNYYRAEKFNRVLRSDFTAAYDQYRNFLTDKRFGTDMRDCLEGKVSSTMLAFKFSSFSRGADVRSNMIFSDGEGEIISSTYEELTYSQENFNRLVIENMKKKGGGKAYDTVYFYDGKPRFVMAVPLEAGGKYAGAVCAYIDMYSLIDNMRKLQYGGVIVHRDNKVVVVGDESIVKDFNKYSGSGDGLFDLSGQKYWMYSSEDVKYGITVYTYVGVTPLWGYYLIFAVVAVILFLLITFMSYKVSDRIAEHTSASVGELLHEIDRVKEAVGSRLDVRTGDEFETIGEHINAMLDSISLLTAKNTELQRLNSEMEMRVLEAKFKPHFLYNTLESIRFAIQLGVDGADKTIYDLTNILRYSVNTDSSEVTVEDDMAHIRSYLSIIKFRYAERFNYRIDVDEECKNAVIPKLLIQPAIENSVKHGFKERMPLNVRIECRSSGDGFVVFTIEDDGGGIEPKRLERIQKMLAEPKEIKSSREYSELHSMARRLVLQHAEGSGVEIYSEFGKWTRTIIRIDMIDCMDNVDSNGSTDNIGGTDKRSGRD